MVPTTETVKPILKQRKPPAAPGPAPFKNASFSKLINILGGKKNRPTAVRVCPQPPDLLLAAAAAASFSLLRAGLGRSLWRGSRGRSEGRTRARGRSSAAGARVGRALGAVRPPRAGGAGCACPGGAWGAGRGEEPAGGAARILARREPPPASTYRAPSPPLAACRSSEKACQHTARRAPTPQWLQALRAKGCPPPPRGLTAAGLAQCPAYSELSLGRENCCS